MKFSCKMVLVLVGVMALALTLPGQETVAETATAEEDADIMALFDNIDEVDDFPADDGAAATSPQVRGGAGGRGRGHGGAGGRRGGAGRRRGRGRGNQGRKNGHLVCPLVTDTVEDMEAFAAECIKEVKSVKVMIKKSRKNRRKPCTHECCQVPAGKKCCISLKEGNCTLALKDAVNLKVTLMRRRGGRGAAGRGRRRGQGQRRAGAAAQEATCPNNQPFLRQLVSCGAQKARVLFVKGLPTALNAKLTCRGDIDCEDGQMCCSSADDRCDRSCQVKPTPAT